MNRSAPFSKLAVLALVGGLSAITATSAQAARNGVFSSYDPTFAYTGDPAYAQSRAQVRRAPAHQRIEKDFGAGKTRNLPYPDRPYGDPDLW